tara:strand:- start:17439 stop:17753 length:315 start_codon:yes stop_codon:yes gene_type:complete
MKHIKIVDITKKVPFLKQEVEIKQLTVKGVKELQLTLDKSKGDVSGLSTLSAIFKATVIGAEGMKDKEFENFPIQALTELSNQILNYNGLGAQDDKGDKLGKKS